ncbi:DUF4190 domain-containing protein [Streptomyces sp. NPDC058745]|uniref:DUF4190 domain-containing protein n=1 Tax=Streptomyces sp. NPDC058745 TaxID=3346621 RepID=UPI0036C0BBD0
MEPSQPPQDSQPPQQGWPAPEPSNPMGAAPGAGTPHTAPGPYGPGPYAPGPYAPFGPYGPGGPGGPGPYGAPARSTNGMAVASLVAGIVCCLPPLGLILGLVALPQIRRKDQAGKGLAVTGIVLSAVSCLLIVSGLVSGGFREAWDGFRKGMDEAARSQSTFELRKGQCYDVDGEVEALTSDVRIVDCAREHEGEVTGSFELTGTTWPGEAKIDGIAEDRCEDISYSYALDYQAIPDDVWTFYYYPSKASWRTGDRVVTCSFIVDGGEPMKGSVRRDETTLGADQVLFLKSTNAIGDALEGEPEEDADEDLDGNKAWAGKVRGALEAASRGLKGHSWPGASAAPVAELTKELDAAAAKWDRLAKAADEDVFWEHYDAAYEMTVWKAEPRVRAALGLATTGPEAGANA